MLATLLIGFSIHSNLVNKICLLIVRSRFNLIRCGHDLADVSGFMELVDVEFINNVDSKSGSSLGTSNPFCPDKEYYEINLVRSSCKKP